MVDFTGWIVITGLLLLAIIFVVYLGSVTVQPYQQAIWTVWGSFKGLLNPGYNFINPIARVIKVDLRTQVLEVPRQEVITKDNSPTNVDAIIYIKVVDTPKAMFQV